ncbi:tripartite tricarboxylate transporter substrate binding protein [Paracandidimonas soli]|uniref:Tripartite-type tricarboxylate transporter receptor subunit TctC n=1 Tax=Paracandidimonas soli TaxID=1917182 RepID=A0A4R3VGN0_9BURK|nr:tripartite tricarboxylate transporter substrate binding protein [Paracandidimonas soli]TCV02869.1 tripartite-type tricarboxylate transporter receptor subunit TctC [Paracandidimonas soli]
MMKKHWRYWLAALALPMAMAQAQEPAFPPSQIRVIVPFPPGGPTDAIGRLVAKGLQDKLGVNVVVENRGGASAVIGSEAVVKSAPDGATLLFNATHHVTNPVFLKTLPYDTKKDFTPIALVAGMASALVVNPKVPARSVNELIELAKKSPDQLSMATFGGANQLSSALFKSMAGIRMVEVGYKGAAPALNDVIAGHVPLMFNSLVTVAPHVQAGKVVALGVTDSKRSALMPDIPTISEAALPGYEAVAWFGLFMPRADNEVPGKLSAVMKEVLADPGLRETLSHMGAEPGTLVGDDFRQFVDAELDKWAKVGEQSGVQKQ